MSISEQLVTIAENVVAIENAIDYAVTTAYAKGYDVLPNGKLVEIKKLVDDLPIANSGSSDNNLFWKHFTSNIKETVSAMSIIQTSSNRIEVSITCANAFAILVRCVEMSAADITFPYSPDAIINVAEGNDAIINVAEGNDATSVPPGESLIFIPYSAETTEHRIAFTGLRNRRRYHCMAALLRTDGTMTSINSLVGSAV